MIVAGAIAVADLVHLGPAAGAGASDTPIVIGGSPLLDQPAPAIDLRTDSGQTVSLATYLGRPVIVNFWASWCIPCKQEFPLFVAAMTRHQAAGLQILGVVYKDSAANARAFMTAQGATWPALLDPKGTAAAAYKVAAVPQSYFIDRQGVVRWVSFGSPLTGAALDDILSKILGPA